MVHEETTRLRKGSTSSRNGTGNPHQPTTLGALVAMGMTKGMMLHTQILPGAPSRQEIIKESPVNWSKGAEKGIRYLESRSQAIHNHRPPPSLPVRPMLQNRQSIIQLNMGLLCLSITCLSENKKGSRTLLQLPDRTIPIFETILLLRAGLI